MCLMNICWRVYKGVNSHKAAALKCCDQYEMEAVCVQTARAQQERAEC